ncbi:MAG: hypothetical protein OdinLCB4_005015 [Candidatus Odinarchaeum yellowstonii]|uniref:Uncharacterized protein n=1 Tax=Odinarchaeota yellowstonii (strain LCB_4) TaxID=1841599 RepID=A0AAF0IAQ3_ODILC|nr:MAG: hypothetical protein OdinLCB4_005015 [Candidatus Odinarchaeum yellowstonii]
MSEVERKEEKEVTEPLGFQKVSKINILLNVISLIDGYRINRCPDFRRLDDNIKKGVLGRVFAEKWKDIRKVLWRIGTFPKNIPNVNKMMTIRIITHIIGLILMLVASSIVIATIFLTMPRLILYIGLALYAVGTSILGFAMLLRRRIAIKIAEYYYEDHDRWKREQAYLKGVVQQLIDGLIRYLRQRKKIGTDKALTQVEKDTPLKKYQKLMAKYMIRMYNVDYTGLIIVKKPNAFRKHYEVVPKLF